MHRYRVAGLGLAFVATATFAQGQRPPSTPDPAAPKGETFVALDADGDGVLSRSELTPLPELQRRFETMDTNRDGTLSMLEFSSSTTGAAGSSSREPIPRSSAPTGSSYPSTPPGGYP